MKKKTVFLLLGGLFVLVCAIACVMLLPGRPAAAPEEAHATPTPAQTTVPTAATPQTASVPAEPTPSPEPYVSPVDFDALRAENPDVCAWLYVPGTSIDYPVLRREGDDSYYLDRGADGSPDLNGALFVESCNDAGFLDPVTVIYGHNMRSGAMFGALQQDYTDGSRFSQCLSIFVYLPERTAEYAVFAAVPFDSVHLLEGCDYSVEWQFNLLLGMVHETRSLKANFAPENDPVFGDRILVLSTCLNGERNSRYLVFAKELSPES